MDPQSLMVPHLLLGRKLFLSHYGKSEANPMVSTWQVIHKLRNLFLKNLPPPL